MAKIIPITINRKQPVVVDTERLIYELPETVKELIENISIQPIYAAREIINTIEDEVIAAAFSQALEDIEGISDSVELVASENTIIKDIMETVSFQNNVSLTENVANIIEDARGFGLISIEDSIREVRESVIAAALSLAVETVNLVKDSLLLELNIKENIITVNDKNTLTTQISDSLGAANDSITLNFAAYDTIAILLEKQDILLSNNEVTPTQIELSRLNATSIDNATTPVLTVTDLAIGTAIESATTTEPADSNVTNATLTMYANAVNSNSNWTTSTDALGNTTTTSAVLSATSSNLGVTNNTTTGTLVVGFRDQTLTDLSVTGSIILSIELSAAINGVLLNTQPTVNVTFAYSFDGTNFTTVRSVTTATTKQIFTADLTSAIGTDYTKINSLVVRATGSVTSGTGLGSNANVQFYRTFLTASFTKTY